MENIIIEKREMKVNDLILQGVSLKITTTTEMRRTIYVMFSQNDSLKIMDILFW